VDREEEEVVHVLEQVVFDLGSTFEPRPFTIYQCLSDSGDRT